MAKKTKAPAAAPQIPAREHLAALQENANSILKLLDSAERPDFAAKAPQVLAHVSEAMVFLARATDQVAAELRAAIEKAEATPGGAGTAGEQVVEEMMRLLNAVQEIHTRLERIRKVMAPGHVVG
jgi:hypothetical protein